MSYKSIEDQVLEVIKPAMRVNLNEDIYRRPETALMDKEFKVILDYFKKGDNLDKCIKNKTDVDKMFSRQLTNIEKLMKKLLNAGIILRFDRASNKKLSCGMCIYPSNEEMHGKIKTAEETGKGFYLYECHNSLVLMDLALYKIFIEHNMNERGLTAVLLHELGHKVYVERQHGEFDRAGRKINNRATGIRVIVTSISGVLTFMISNNKLAKYVPIAGIIGYILSFGLTLLYLNSRNKISVDTYVKTEHLSDSLPIRYGYGYEIAKCMDIFYSMSKIQDASKNKFIKFIQNNLLLGSGNNDLNTDRLRREEILKVLKQEYNNPNNSEHEKKILKKIIDDVEEMMRLNEESLFKSYSDALTQLNEMMTFRSVEIGKCKELINSPEALKIMRKQIKKGYYIVQSLEDLNPLALKVVMNKIEEMAAVVTRTSTTSKRTTYNNENDSGGNMVTKVINNVVPNANISSKTNINSNSHYEKKTLQLKNIVCMPLEDNLCIIEGNDKGRAISITMIFMNENESIKFVRFQTSLFKF